MFKRGTAVEKVVNYLIRRGETTRLMIPVPIQIEQGKSDTTVFKTWTDELVKQYRRKGLRVDYNVYGGDYHGVLAEGWPAATAFVKARLP